MKKLNMFLIALLLITQSILGPISIVSAEGINSDATNADANEVFEEENTQLDDAITTTESVNVDEKPETESTDDESITETETTGDNSDVNEDSAEDAAIDDVETGNESEDSEEVTNAEIDTLAEEEEEDEEEHSIASVGVIEEANVSFSKLVVNGVDIEKEEDAHKVEPKIGNNVSVHYTFEISNPQVDYEAGSTFTFDLPSALLVFDAGSLSGQFTDDDLKFKYSTHGNTVTVELVEGTIGEGSHYDGNLNFHAQFGQNGAEDGLEQTVRIPVAGGEELEFVFTFQPQQPGEDISKKGTAKIAEDGKRYIEWEVWVNTAASKLNNAQVEDNFGDGHELDGDITVERYIVGLTGVGDKVDATNIANNFPVALDNGYYAYKLTYKSLVTREAKNTTESFTNNATLTNDDKTSNAKATATHTYGTKLDKSLVGGNKYKLNWSIKYNYFGSQFNSKTLTDTIDGNHIIIEDSIKVYSVTLDASSNGTKGDLVSPQPSAKVDADGKSFTIDLKSPNGEAYLIEYETESTEEFVTGHENIVNRVFYDQENDEARHYNYEDIFHKSRGSIDFDKKEITWTLRVNVEKDMKNFVIEDIFKSYDKDGTRQTLVNPENPFVFSNGAPNYNSFNLIDKDPTKGFTLNFGDLAGGTSFTITYKTKFDILPNGAAYDEYKNTATATWEGKTQGWKVEKSAQYNPSNTPTGNNGYKYGSFDHANQVFNWTVGININKQQINGSTLVDEIGPGHKLIPGTIKIQKLQLGNSDWGDPVGDDLASEFIVKENDSLDGFTVNFNKDTTDAYMITYQTEDDDNIIGQPDGNHSYENVATFTTIDDKEFKLKASTTVQHGNKVIEKGPQQNPNDETITWTIDVNKSHSALGNIVLTDVMSENQLILPETFQKREILMAANGNISYGPWEPVIPDELKIDHEENRFELKLGTLDGKGYQIEYKTFFLGAHLDKFSNKASINYEGVEEGIDKESGVVDQEYKHNQSDGEISSTKGTLEIHKIGFNQLTGERINLEGVTFHLYNKTGTVKLAEATSDKDGKLIFENVRYGKYKLKEVDGTPEGYIPLDKNGKDVTINDETNILEDGKTVEVINNEDVDLENACEFFKVTVKDVDGKPLPKNKEVTISNGDFELVKTTGVHGEINYQLSELPAGAYKVFVDDVEYGEVQVSYEGDNCEDEVQIAPSCEIFTVTIYNADKKPHAGADILIKKSQNEDVIANGTTNADGEIEIQSKDLPAGKYEVYEGKIKIGEIDVSYVDGNCEASVNMLPVEACEIFTVTVKDADGKPLVKETVTIVVNDADKTFTTDKDGQFTFAYGDIAAGTYEVQFDDATIGEIEVSFAGEDCKAQIQLAPTCDLFTVAINDADGKLSAGTTVEIVGNDKTVTKTTGKNGQFTFGYGDIEAGTYDVQLDGATIGQIEVSFAGDDCNAQVQLAPTCELFTVTVNNADGKPVVETEVDVVGVGKTVSKTTDENGQFNFAYGDIAAGTYEVQLDDVTIGEIEVSFADENCNDQIQIAPTCPIFEVTIKDADGNVSPAKTVTIKDEEGNEVATGKTDKNGKIQVPSEELPAGTYIVYEGEALIGEIEVSHIDNCGTEVQVAPSCELFTVTVKDADGIVRPNVTITIKDFADNEIAAEQTDENGKIQVSSKDLPAGIYKVYEGETFIDEILVTHIDNCETEVQYAPTCPIFEVMVKDADGNGLQDATITIKDKKGNEIITSKTDDNGKIQVPSNELLSGKYDVYEGETFIGEIKVSHVDNCETEIQFAPACESFTIIAKDEDGQVRPNVSITIKDLDGNDIATEETDENGEIQVSSKNLPAGVYVVYEDDTLIGEIKVSHVDNCETEIQLAPACELFTVTVKDADGKVLQDTSVTIKDKDGNEIITAETDEDGKIQAPSKDLPAGKYEVYEGETLIGEITVSHIDNCEAEVQYAPKCPIFEVIVKDADNNAHPNSTFTIKDKKNNEIITAETDEDGKIQIPSNDLPAGTYEVYEGETFIGEIEVSHIDNCETEIQLAPTCELFTITVNNADGKPQVNTEVTIIVDEEKSITKTTDDNGQFTFEYLEIKAGVYEVQLDGTTIGEIEVSFAGEECVDQIQLAPSCPFFEVTIKDEHGKERSTIAVTIKDKDGNDVYTEETDKNGKIHVPSNELPAGSYDVYEGDTLIDEIEVSYLDNCETEVQAAPSCPVFTLTITDHDKKPLDGAEVVVKDANGEIAATGKTDANGEIVFEKPFTAGSYIVLVNGAEVGTITVSADDCTASIALEADEDKPVPPGEPSDPKKPTEPIKTGNLGETGKTNATKIGSKLPQTGEELFTYMIALGVLFLATGAFILFRKRRNASVK